MTQLSRLPQIVESPQSLEPAGLCVVPPMELHEIERIDFEAPQRAVDDRLHVPTVDPGQEIEIGHELCMNPHPLCRLRPAGRENPRARLPVEVFDAGVDVGAIEGENACVEGDDEIIDGADPIDLSVPPGKLPPAADEARNRITRRQFDGLDARHPAPREGKGVAVVSERRNRRTRTRLIRNRLRQFGSGQAISLSLVIQSLRWLGRCLAASSGRTAAIE